MNLCVYFRGYCIYKIRHHRLNTVEILINKNKLSTMKITRLKVREYLMWYLSVYDFFAAAEDSDPDWPGAPERQRAGACRPTETSNGVLYLYCHSPP